jgi:uncharacterized protein (DUF849 family)
MTPHVIISCALTGGGDTTGSSPHVPITPQQIAEEAIAARQAGAAVAHIHVRDPATGKPSRDVALYREVVSRIRDAGSDVLINLTTGPGARYVPDAAAPGFAGKGTSMASPEDRVAHVLELRPDICSLDVATMNFGQHAFVNVPAHLQRMATMIREAGVKPELEVFDLGHIELAKRLIAEGFVADPPFLQLCTGIPWGAPSNTETMLAMRNALPPGATWSAFGISRHQFPMAAQAVILGGHLRVGLEDNLYLARGKLSPGNAPLVARAVEIVQALGATVATPEEARGILHLAPAA